MRVDWCVSSWFRIKNTHSHSHAKWIHTHTHTHNEGAMKPQFLHMSKSPPLIGLMRGVKTLLDPHNILNPGKVLPPIDGVAGQAHTEAHTAQRV